LLKTYVALYNQSGITYSYFTLVLLIELKNSAGGLIEHHTACIDKAVV